MCIKNAVRIIILIGILFIIPEILFAHSLKVIRVYDGDTIKAKGDGTVIKVRLVGIDAPECNGRRSHHGQPYSLESKRYLEAMILNKVVDIQYLRPDKNNFYLGEIFLEGKSINLEMIRSGFAEAYQWKSLGAFSLEPFLVAERDAKALKKGMWVQGNSYVSPALWRETVKKRLTRLMFFGISAKKEKN